MSPLPSSALAALSMNRRDRRRRHLTVGAQIRCQPHQLGFDLVPLDGHRSMFDGYHRPVGHDRAAGPVGGSELDVAGSHQILRDDDRFRVCRDRHVVVDLEGHLGLRTRG